MTKTLLALGLTALIGSTPALAGHDHDHGHKGPRKYVVALEQSKISAAQAIAIAENLHDDKQEYEIRVDAVSGEITARKSEYEDKLPRRGSITLTQAIETAEKETGAKTVEADLDGKHSGLVYEIELLGNDTRYDVDISADDGKVLRKDEKKRPPRMVGMKDGNNPPPPPAETSAAQ